MRGISGDFDVTDQLFIRYSSDVRYLRKRGIQRDVSVIKDHYDSVNGGSSEDHCNGVWFSHEIC